MSEEDAELDRELNARHLHGEELAEKVRALFAQFRHAHDLKVELPYAIHENSLHVSEVAFYVMDAHSGQRWRIFPSIFIQTRPASLTTFTLFFNTEDGQAISQECATVEAFAEAIGQQALLVAQGAPHLRNERRVSPRRTLNMPTLITSPDGTVSLLATIVNRSRNGLLVELSSDDVLPSQLIVLVDQKSQRFDKVWQIGKSVGLVSVPEEPARPA